MCLTGSGGLRLNGDVASCSSASRNHTLKGVLQLGEVHACLGFTVPAAQHQLVSVAMVTMRVENATVMYGYCIFVDVSVLYLHHTPVFIYKQATLETPKL